MSDIDLEAIRANDRRWVDRGRAVDSIGRERRLLLEYIDGLMALAEDIALDIKLIKRAHTNYQPKPADDFLDSPDTDKLPP